MQGLKAEILRGFWYMAIPGAQLAPGKMANLRMLDEPVLVGRGKDGKVFALRDICPHRGVPLHYGSFDGEAITCSFHAWRFNRDGDCIDVPSMVDGQRIDMSKIRCGAYPCIEQQGIVWVYFARDGEEPSGATEKPPLVPLFAEDKPPDTHVEATFPCSIDHTTFGLMDPAHVAYVHKSRWFRAKTGIVREKAKAFEPAPLGFKMASHQVPESQTFYKLLGSKVMAEISYSLPAIRIEELHGNKHNVVGMSVLTPITDEKTTFHQMFWTTIGWAKPLRPLMTALSRRFLNQDRDIALQQREGLLDEPKLMLINDANTQARWWMHLKDEWVNSGKEGRPFVNPVQPKTLRFKS